MRDDYLQQHPSPPIDQNTAPTTPIDATAMGMAAELLCKLNTQLGT
jgi:hypothetical protein